MFYKVEKLRVSKHKHWESILDFRTRNNNNIKNKHNLIMVL